LTRSIQVDARGEVAELKDNINTMITNLRLTTDLNTEQDWLKTNLAKFTNMLQGQRDLTTVGRLLLTELTPLVNAHMGVIYQVENEDNPLMRLLAAYAGDGNSPNPQILQFGEGLIGQCAMDKAPAAGIGNPRRRGPDQFSIAARGAEEPRGAAGAVREPGQGRH